MNKIKVCHIITKLELGGAQRNTLHTVANLDTSRFEASLISGIGGLLDSEAGSISHIRTYFIPSLIRRINPVLDITALIGIYKTLKKIKPDIVHTHSSKAGILGRLAAKLAGVPVVLHTYHGFGFNDFQNIIVRSAYVVAERLAVNFTDRFIAVTKEDIKKGVGHGIGYEAGYSLIRSGIDITKYAADPAGKDALIKELELKRDDKVVTTIGPFKPQKNLGDFIKACAIVAAEAPKTRFFIVGDGRQRGMLEKLIKKYDLSGKLTLLGWRKDIPQILSVTDIFAMTSLWEGLPRAILEAMCTGLPVVANAVDGVKEIVKDGETGYLIKPGDINDFAAKLKNLLKNPERAKSMGKKGASLISQQYDINFMVRQQENLYTELMENKNEHEIR